jgi:trans-L-3-hydroxyproline dehydratase
MTARLKIVDMHTAAEPVRIVEAGYPELAGATILEKRRDALTRFDHLRRTMMLEPRGHEGMYGVIPTAASRPDASFAVLFTHQEGYSTMCGHATVALGRWAVDTGRVPMMDGVARFGMEAPCGLIEVEVRERAGQVPFVSFLSVESFAGPLDKTVAVPGIGPVQFDIAFGGAFYAILPASRIGLPLMTTPLEQLVQAGTAITDAVRAALAIRHPREADLGFLYGTILTDDAVLGEAPSYNLCIFAQGQIDRSPTGSGVTARLALAAARGQLAVGKLCEIRGVSGPGFTAALASIEHGADSVVSRVKVGGEAFYMARSELVVEAGDPFAAGFKLPRHFNELPS